MHEINAPKDPLTYRHPRTLESAFGPYQRGGIYEEVPPMEPADKVVLTASIAVLLMLLLIGVLA